MSSSRWRVQPALDAFLFGDDAHGVQGVVQLVGVRDFGPRLFAHLGDSRGVELADVGRAFRVEPAALRDRERAPLFEGRIVQIGIRPRRQDFRGERRRLDQILGDDLDRARLEADQQIAQAIDVHGVVQAIVERLFDQRVIGNLARPRQVFRAGDLIGEKHGDQVFGRHALDLRRRALAAHVAADGERDARVPAPARGEHRRVEHGLDQRVFDRLAVEEARHTLELEAVRLAERQDDGVFGGGGLQLEVERAAEFLAQRESERAVDARTERRVDDELLPAGFVEETLEDQRVAFRKFAEHGFRRGEVFDHLFGGRARQVVALDRPVDGARDGVRGDLRQQRFDVGAQSRHRFRELVGARRRFAQPERDAGRLALGVFDAHAARLRRAGSCMKCCRAGRRRPRGFRWRSLR